MFSNLRFLLAMLLVAVFISFADAAPLRARSVTKVKVVNAPAPAAANVTVVKVQSAPPPPTVTAVFVQGASYAPPPSVTVFGVGCGHRR